MREPGVTEPNPLPCPAPVVHITRNDITTRVCTPSFPYDPSGRERSNQLVIFALPYRNHLTLPFHLLPSREPARPDPVPQLTLSKTVLERACRKTTSL